LAQAILAQAMAKRHLPPFYDYAPIPEPPMALRSEDPWLVDDPWRRWNPGGYAPEATRSEKARQVQPMVTIRTVAGDTISFRDKDIALSFLEPLRDRLAENAPIGSEALLADTMVASMPGQGWRTRATETKLFRLRKDSVDGQACDSRPMKGCAPFSEVTPAEWKQIQRGRAGLCAYFQKGTCKVEARCRFQHEGDEIVNPGGVMEETPKANSLPNPLQEQIGSARTAHPAANIAAGSSASDDDADAASGSARVPDDDTSVECEAAALADVAAKFMPPLMPQRRRYPVSFDPDLQGPIVDIDVRPMTDDSGDLRDDLKHRLRDLRLHRARERGQLEVYIHVDGHPKVFFDLAESVKGMLEHTDVSGAPKPIQVFWMRPQRPESLCEWHKHETLVVVNSHCLYTFGGVPVLAE